MALIGERKRKLNLSIGLPELAVKRSRFVPYSVSATTTVFSTTALFSSSSSSDTNISELDFEKIQVLGHGISGTVYKVCHKATSNHYALKVVHGDSNPEVRRHLLQEIDILRRTDSPCVVCCHAVFEKPSGDVSFLMEYMDSGSLETELKSHGKMSESKIADVARQVTKGLHYLHSKKIVHRDIKPANLLVNSKKEVKIADFGVSKIIGPTLDACNSFVGTCAYMSPERFDPEKYGNGRGNYDGYAGDIWSLGVTLMELYMGHFPLLPVGQRPDWATLMCAVCFGEVPGLPENVSEEFRSFVDCCLDKDSTKRWTAAQLLTHPFLCHDSVSVS
ncbi:mitogen-activated protein kinase kinase 9 [Ziziphus jujuba]|uniref:mitogen-activated protein kinase kinase n=1 Tax=Ziziphus jujuba TaxID=326968 RepID=A0A6P3ZU52_ZIZJJ|nr:mitogen-activated protein kinase kinase 9 [Ziziphus jujuba]